MDFSKWLYGFKTLVRIFLKTGLDKYIALRYATYIEVRCIESRYIVEKAESTAAGQDVILMKEKFWRESYEMENRGSENHGGGAVGFGNSVIRLLGVLDLAAVAVLVFLAVIRFCRKE